MKNISVLVICLFLFGSLKAQQSGPTDSSRNIISAQFPKGEKGWKKFLLKKMDDFTAEEQYPKGEFTLTVVVSFKVDTTGEVIEERVHKSCGNSRIDLYAVSVLESSPNWIPAKENGKPIKSRALQSIRFTGRGF